MRAPAGASASVAKPAQRTMIREMSRPQRTAWRNWAEYVPAWLTLQLLERLPLPAAERVASLLASVLRLATPRWRRTAQRNLELAFPDSEPAWRRQIERGCYANLGRVLLALAKAPRLTPDNVGRWIDYDGFEHYEQARA